MARILCRDLTKRFGSVTAVDRLNLEIHDREFMVLLGPSGCGKTTTLNIIAGLEELSAGDLYFDDTVVNFMPPHKREVAMVFQSYALYPHKTVYENIAFGMRLRRLPAAEIDQRVRAAAAELEIAHLLERRPHQLSGGQRQRVALGRAIVRKPSVFLMDEPLSNLDAALRISMRTLIKKLHQTIRTTFVYVTHDQAEALTLADRIAVMKDGLLQQLGTPDEVYHRPRNLFVASFLGSPPMNFIEGRLEIAQGALCFRRGAGGGFGRQRAFRRQGGARLAARLGELSRRGRRGNGADVPRRQGHAADSRRRGDVRGQSAPAAPVRQGDRRGAARMKPAPFHYHAPGTLAEALKLLAAHGSEAKLLAGGQSLVPTMNFRLARPTHVVDLNGVPGLDFLREADGVIEIGALARHQALADSPLLARLNPLMSLAAGTIGYHAIRTRGTVGGSLAHADPAAQWPLMATLFNATIHAASVRGVRSVPATEFFRAVFTTALEADEIVTHVSFPVVRPEERWDYRWFARRRGDFAVVAVATTVRLDARGQVGDLRLAVGGAEPCPVNLAARMAGHRGRPLNASLADEIAGEAAQTVDPMADDRASAVFRRELVQHLTSCTLQACLNGARA
jgi:multiple sugar transport system ATP-binding protein